MASPEIMRQQVPEQMADPSTHTKLLGLLRQIEVTQQEPPPINQKMDLLDGLYQEAQIEVLRIKENTTKQNNALRAQVGRMGNLPNPLGIQGLLNFVATETKTSIEDMGDVPETINAGVNAAQGTSLAMAVTPALAGTFLGLPGAIAVSMGLGVGSAALTNKATELLGKIPLIGRLPEKVRRFGVTGGLLAGALGLTGAIGGAAAVTAALPLVAVVGGAAALFKWKQRSDEAAQRQEYIKQAEAALRARAMRTTAASAQRQPREGDAAPQFSMAA
jgi:hypothetical protein